LAKINALTSMKKNPDLAFPNVYVLHILNMVNHPMLELLICLAINVNVLELL
jgi:hypothetical protein